MRQMDLRESCCGQPCRSRRYGRAGKTDDTDVRVYTVQENDGIRAARLLESLDNGTRATGNIGAAVSSDLCLVADASE